MVLRRVVLSTSANSSTPPPQAEGLKNDTTISTQILPVPNPVTSYWLSEPSPHSALRSTPSLPSSCDIAIIGTGMAGVLTAYHILQNARAASENVPHVVLLEARELCSGATGRNGGHVKAKTATLCALKSEGERDKMQAFVLGSIGDLKRVVDDEGLEEHCEFELRRSFDVFQDEEELRKVLGVYDEARKKGEAWTRERTFLEGGRAENVSGIRGAVGAFSVPAASLWPYKFVTGLLSRLIARYPSHLNIQTNTPVTSLSLINVLTTSRGTLKAGKVVLATNAWTAGLLGGFEGTITPVKGMACHIKAPEVVFPHLGNTYNIHYAPADEKGVDYLNPRPDGGIVVGGGSWHFREKKELWKGNFDDSMRLPESVERHWQDTYMQRSFLGWENSHASPDSIWVGIQGYTSDGMSWVGRVPDFSGMGDGVKGGKKKQQWMLAGFNGGGMAQIPRLARAVAEMVGGDIEYEDVKGEFGLLEGCGTERMM